MNKTSFHLQEGEKLIKEYDKVLIRILPDPLMAVRFFNYKMYLTDKRIFIDGESSENTTYNFFFKKSDSLASSDKYCSYIKSVDLDRFGKGFSLSIKNKGFLSFIPIRAVIMGTSDLDFAFNFVKQNLD
jgi:hypothetical protein